MAVTRFWMFLTRVHASHPDVVILKIHDFNTFSLVFTFVLDHTLSNWESFPPAMASLLLISVVMLASLISDPRCPKLSTQSIASPPTVWWFSAVAAIHYFRSLHIYMQPFIFTMLLDGINDVFQTFLDFDNKAWSSAYLNSPMSSPFTLGSSYSPAFGSFSTSLILISTYFNFDVINIWWMWVFWGLPRCDFDCTLKKCSFYARNRVQQYCIITWD